jgi:hypothetical protein
MTATAQFIWESRARSRSRMPLGAIGSDVGGALVDKPCDP